MDDGNGGNDTAPLDIDVLKVPDMPVFVVDMIEKPGAFVGTIYINSIAFSAYDRDEDNLVYMKISGPSWLVVALDGSIYGIPSTSDVGENLVTVMVDDGDGGTDTATISIYVQPAAVSSGQPNILYILADDLGYADISAMGWADLEFETPNIDSIFNGGVYFQAGLVPNSVCAPSRAGLITGRMGSRFGFEANIGAAFTTAPGSVAGLPVGQKTMGDVLKAAGYKTFAIGKWHLGDNLSLFHPNVRGFDEFFGLLGGGRPYIQSLVHSESNDELLHNYDSVTEPSDLYLTDFLTDEALTYITDQTNNNPDQPWFMYMSYTAPHGPMDAKEADFLRAPLASHYGTNYSSPKPVNILMPDGSVESFSEDDNDYMRRVYAAMVLNMDDNVGRLLHKLSELGIAENTLVVFHSDNGGPLTGSNWSRNSPIRGEKGTLWEGGIRVPFGMCWPGVIPAGQVVGHDTPISGLDLMPTFAAISGADQVQEIRTDGINIMPLCRGRLSTLPERTFYWRRGAMQNTAIRSGDWKYYNNYSNGDEYLFNLENSGSEWGTNLLSANPDTANTLIAEYAAFLDEIPDAAFDSDSYFLAITTYDLDDAQVGVTYSMPLTANTPSGASEPTWSITAGKPSWLSINSSTGELTGTPSASDDKYNTITIQAESGGNTTDYKVPLIVQGGVDPDDLDSDGLPDAWELEQFGGTGVSSGTSGEDQDGDGFSDTYEYLTGTNANDANSRFAVGVSSSGRTLSVTIDGHAGNSYLLQTTKTLDSDTWFYGDSIDNLEADGTVTLESPNTGDGSFGRVIVQ